MPASCYRLCFTLTEINFNLRHAMVKLTFYINKFVLITKVLALVRRSSQLLICCFYIMYEFPSSENIVLDSASIMVLPVLTVSCGDVSPCGF